ncbi:hypothetical protein R4Z10_08995 [Niallia sp. XMNu-256]|uniref:sigma factor n=1 Tax=Niallia sp. XMNu-256 TaxID=3082444 RepID=UPI0030D42A0B
MKENFDDIYKIYFHEIYRFLLSLCHDHHLAEDLVQETFSVLISILRITMETR